MYTFAIDKKTTFNQELFKKAQSDGKLSLINKDSSKIRLGDDKKYDVIFLDPPTFSNTKSTEQTLDIQRDHSALIDACLQWLSPNGQMYFSNNFKGFTLDESVSERCIVKDLTRASIDLDFDRRAPHFLFKISPKTDNELV